MSAESLIKRIITIITHEGPPEFRGQRFHQTAGPWIEPLGVKGSGIGIQVFYKEGMDTGKYCCVFSCNIPQEPGK